MRTILLCSCFGMSIAHGLRAQAPPVLWQSCLGGSWEDRAWAIAPTSGNGSIMAGRSESNDGDVSGNHSILDDIWVVKQNDLGAIQWQKCIGGTGTEEGYEIVPASGGGYMVVGLSGSDDGDATTMQGFVDGWLVKLDSTGTIVWQRSAGGTTIDLLTSVVENGGGQWIGAGRTDSNDGDVSGNHGGTDAWLMAVSPAGAFTGQACLGGSGEDDFRHITATMDGNFVAVGSTTSNDGDVSGNHGGTDVWVVKLDSTGTILWQHCFGGSATDQGMRVLPTPDNGFLVAATTASSDGDVSDNNGATDLWLLKLDGTGNLLWEETFGGTSIDNVWSIAPYGTGYAMAGSTLSNDGDVSGLHGSFGFMDAWVIGVNGGGALLWQRCLGGLDTDYALALAPTTSGQLLVGGLTDSNDGDVSGQHGESDAWVVRLDGTFSGIQDLAPPGPVVRPTLASTSVRVTVDERILGGAVDLVDAGGTVVRTTRMNGIVADLYVADLPRGAYVIRVHHSRGVQHARVVLE